MQQNTNLPKRYERCRPGKCHMARSQDTCARFTSPVDGAPLRDFSITPPIMPGSCSGYISHAYAVRVNELEKKPAGRSFKGFGGEE